MKKSLGAKTILYPTPVFIVGTYDKDGKPNAMNVAWGGLCCSSPPSVAISLRKTTYTYGNIVERKAFTVNIPSETQVKEANHFVIVSGEFSRSSAYFWRKRKYIFLMRVREEYKKALSKGTGLLLLFLN